MEGLPLWASIQFRLMWYECVCVCMCVCACMCVCVCVLTAGSSPVEVSGLSPGKHVLKVVPTGCGRNRMNLKTTITIE